MNHREAAALREALTRLEQGPNDGWIRMLDGSSDTGSRRSTAERLRSLEIWLDSWVLPAMKSAVTRYWRPTTARRIRGRITIATRAAVLRETLRAGEARQARNFEDPPYWVGFYQAIARQAIEELEYRDATAEGRS